MDDLYQELNQLTETLEKIGVDADPRQLKDRRKVERDFPLIDSDAQYVTQDRRKCSEDRRSQDTVDLQNSELSDLDMEIPKELEPLLRNERD